MKETKKSDSSKEPNPKNNRDASPQDTPHRTEAPGAAAPSRDLNIISVNLSIFALFAALVFSYFAYFAHQIAGVRAEIMSKVLEINAIATPHRMSFITLAGPYEYYYLKRKEILLREFQSIEQALQESKLDTATKAAYGKKLQEILTIISYSFPFKRMIDFDKEGKWTFDPNNYESIQSSDNLNANVPPYKRIGVPSSYNTIFLKKQIDEINHIHGRFTLYLKDSKEKIVEAVALANGLKDGHDRERLRRYVDSLIEYLENHHRLMVPLGLTIVRSDYLIKKANITLFGVLCCLLAMNFCAGVVVPLFVDKLRNVRLFWAIPLLAFAVGVTVLFWVSVYSLPG